MALPFKLRIRGSHRVAQQKRTRPVKSIASESTSRRAKDKGKHPVRYERNRQRDILSSRLYRLQMTDEERIRSNKLAAIRQRRYRKRQREKLEAMKAEAKRKGNQHGDKCLTRGALEKIRLQRKKAAEKKAKQRANWSEAKKEEVKSRRRAAYAAKAAEKRRCQSTVGIQTDAFEQSELSVGKEQLSTGDPTCISTSAIPDVPPSTSTSPPITAGETPTHIPSSRAARRKRLSRIRKYLPRNADHFVEMLEDMHKVASPSKKAALKRAGLGTSKQKTFETELVKVVKEQLQSKGSKNGLSTRQNLASSLNSLSSSRLQRYASRRFEINRKLIVNRFKKPGGRPVLPQSTITSVCSFYEASAQPLPLKKFVSKKTGKPLMVLNSPIYKLYTQFKSQNANINLCLSNFYQLKPKHIRTMRQASYRGCLCETCENVRLKIDSLDKRLEADGHRALKLINAESVLHLTLCPKDERLSFHRLPCVKRACRNCGMKMLDSHLQQVSAEQRSRLVSWKKWDMVEEEVKTIKTKKRKLVVKNGTLQELIQELRKEVEVYALHVFNWHWQAKQFKSIKQNLPDKWVLSVWDFAENYCCYFQDEIQSAYWARNQVTIHPVVNYYKCENSECQQQVTESIVFISDDNVHDYNAVHAYMKLVALHLIQKRNLKLTRMVRFSDNAACQYKSKGPIADISHASADYSFSINHNYYGSRHGKGASDGESAVVKSHVSRAVNSGLAVISNARDFYDFCVGHLQKDPISEECLHFRRYFYYIDDVQRERGRSQIPTLQGTRSLHSILSTESVSAVQTRSLSCFCQACIQGYGKCANTEYVDEWKPQQLTKTTTDVDVSEAVEQDAPKWAEEEVITSNNGCFGDNSPEAQQLQMGSYVAVKFSMAGKKNVIYLAMVQGIVEEQVGLKFLQRRRSGAFEFTNEHIHLHPLSDICGVISPPSMSLENRAFAYKFSQNELDQLDYVNKCIIK